MSEDIKRRLEEMAKLSLISNTISETHQKNLKMYAFCFFENVKSAKIDYDLGHARNDETKEIQHNFYVAYHLDTEETSNEKAKDKRFKALEASVRALFWKEIKVLVYFKDKLVYESKDV